MHYLQKHCENIWNRIYSSVENNQASSSKSIEIRNDISKLVIYGFCAKPDHNVNSYFTRKTIEQQKGIKVCSTGTAPKPNKIKID